jgi:hypothetical protein
MLENENVYLCDQSIPKPKKSVRMMNHKQLNSFCRIFCCMLRLAWKIQILKLICMLENENSCDVKIELWDKACNKKVNDNSSVKNTIRNFI